MSYEKNLVLCRFYGKSIPKVITVLEGVVSHVGYHPPKKKRVKIMTGILFVTFICPSLSNFALFQVSLYIALSLGSTTPLFGFLLELILGKQPSFRGFLGAILSVGGVIVLATFGLGESKSTR